MSSPQITLQTVTGVDVELTIAGPGSRSYAFIIDWHIRVLLALAWWMVGHLIYFGSFTMPESPGPGYTLWVWLPSSAAPDRAVLEAELRRTPEVRVAVGSPADDVEGFRRSHRDAVEVRRLVARLGADDQLVAFEDVQLAALVTRDEARAEEFVRSVLGELADASVELQETVRSYLASLGNASTAAFTMRSIVAGSASFPGMAGGSAATASPTIWRTISGSASLPS